MLTVSLLSAFAGEPVVLYEEEPERALRRVSRHTGITEARPRRWSELLAGEPPLIVGAETLEPCRGEAASNAELLKLLGLAEELRLAMRTEAWHATLADAEQAWSCLSEPADATLGARLYFLLGIAAFAEGDPLAAARSFEAALRSNPSLDWDEDFAPDAREVFEEVRSRPSPVPVAMRLVPGGSTPPLRVDGRTPVVQDGVVEIPAGLHLLQLEEEGRIWARLDGDAWLFLPGPTPDPASEAQTLAGRHRLEGLAAGAGVDHLLVPSGSLTWELVEGSWARRRTPAARRFGPPLALAGLTLAAAGALWMGAERRTAAQHIDAVDDRTDTAAYAELDRLHASSRLRWTAGLGLLGGGALVAGAGVTLVVTTW